ncbi:MAG: cytochrome b/b6 domain-containing protein [Thiobacillaceae bacterium]|nr:cytochrome b/b6 domain-containing protein [Thiobacillaceae bacterium]MCX7672266.1 cytochrome b/b6 domain-containing protein [Thiobacillaceae bacterium]MDW8322946.1 cytochrome b/b6 domain-containing protein [Burkholderiales bacterium]
MTQKVYIFKRFERFWHWSQAGLIIFLLITGLEIHGWYSLFGFERAYNNHVIAAWTLVGLWVFAIFWHFTTGEWRQYIPTTKNVMLMVRYYTQGIFRGEPHPHRQTALSKHNPLQRLAYLFMLVVAGPVIWTTGWLLLFYDQWGNWGLADLSLATVATWHLIAAYTFLLFLIVHVYLTTTGATPLSHIKAMITGWEEVH